MSNPFLTCCTEQTALVGKVRDEFNCIPVENEEFRRIAESRALEALKPKRETKFVGKVSGKLLQPRNLVPGDKGAFVVSIIFHTSSTILTANFFTASDETSESTRTRQQDDSHAAERITRPYL
jgi:hypothetical protein